MPDWLIWLLLAGVLAAGEATSLTFVMIMASGGAAAGSVTAALGAPVVVQVLVAIIGTLALLGLARPAAVRHFNSGPLVVTGPDALVGQDAVVLQPVTERDGRVRLNGAEWSARAKDPKQDLPTGTVVSVVGIEGATAIVWQDPFGERTNA
jgi:membrane protein implicated in regulation of membrane protease activity